MLGENLQLILNNQSLITTMDRNSLLKSSRVQFISLFNEMIEGVVHRSIEALYQKADKSLNSQEQRRLLDARSFIVRNEKKLASQIVRHMETLLDRSFHTAYDTFRPSFFTTAKAGSIALMDISTFEDDLRLDIITARFRNEAGEQLRDLNIRIAILFECNDIAERENPFRPYLLTRSITLGVDVTQVESGLFIPITDQIAEELLHNVVKLYEGVNTHLSESGVAAQLQFKPQRTTSDGMHYTDDESLDALMQVRKALTPNSLPLSDLVKKNVELAVSNQFARIEHLLNTIKLRQQKAKQKPTNATGFPEINLDLLNDSIQANHPPHTGVVGSFINHAGATVSGWLDGVHEVGDALRSVFLGGTRSFNKDTAIETEQPDQANVPNYVSISPQLHSALKNSLPPANEMMGLDGEVRNLLIESRDNLNALASDQHEKMTIDIVAMLFEFILKDHQVPAEVRAQLGRLQFSVLKMALMDSGLLTKKSHPARLLLNRIGSISIGLQQIDPTGERISAEICSIVEALLANDPESPEIFSKMLDQLDVFIARELLASSAGIGSTANAAGNAEQRIRRFEQVSVKLEQMLDEIAVAPTLRQFLLGTWLRVIERIERNPNEDSTRFRLVVPDLLWTVLPKINQSDRSLLLQTITTLIPMLREGMKLVECSFQQQQEFLNWLAEAHNTAVRDAAGEEVVPSLLDMEKRFHAFVYPDDTILNEPPLPSTLSPKIETQRLYIDEAIQELETELSTADALENLDITLDITSVPLDQADHSNEANNHSDRDLSADPQLFIASFGARGYSYEESDSDLFVEDESAEAETSSEVRKPEEDLLDRLRSGVVVEINLSGIPTLGRLNWISPNSSKLILTMNGQKTPSIVSVRMFRRMLKNSHARFVEVAPLFERAVQSLLESADLVDLTYSS